MAEDRMEALWNSNDGKAWKMALDKYYGSVKPSNLELEDWMASIDYREIGALDAEGFYAFLHDKYFVWKYTDPNRLASTRKCLRRYLDDGKLSELDDIKNKLFSFDRRDIRRGLSIAYRIRGLGSAGASGLLSVLFPESFGTVDQFVVKNLQEVSDLAGSAWLSKVIPESIKLDEAVALIKMMRRRADELNMANSTSFWTPRKIDMVLWAVREEKPKPVFGSIALRKLTGRECFCYAGEPLEKKTSDFWKWAFSNVASNTTRGVLAEFIVAIALGLDREGIREEWQPYDLVTADGIRIEVKSSSYLQSWEQKSLSKPQFSCGKKNLDATIEQDGMKVRRSDVYVFALVSETDKGKLNMLELDQWKFFVISAHALDVALGDQKTLSLNALKKMKCKEADFMGLKEAVNSI